MLLLDQILYLWVYLNQFWSIKRLSRSTGQLPAVVAVRRLLSWASGRSTPFLCEAIFCIYCRGDLENRHMWPSRCWILGAKQKYSGCVCAFENGFGYIPWHLRCEESACPPWEAHTLQEGLRKAWLLTQCLLVAIKCTLCTRCRTVKIQHNTVSGFPHVVLLMIIELFHKSATGKCPFLSLSTSQAVVNPQEYHLHTEIITEKCYVF